MLEALEEADDSFQRSAHSRQGFGLPLADQQPQAMPPTMAPGTKPVSVPVMSSIGQGSS
jgi:hypothetical protein